MRWTRGLVWIGSNLFGWMFDSDALAAALRHRPFAYGTHSAVSDLGNVFGEFVLPVAVAILAPKSRSSGRLRHWVSTWSGAW